MKWFFYTLPPFTIGFALLCFVPDLGTLAGLMTAFVVPFSQLIGPAVLGLIASRKNMLGHRMSMFDLVVLYIGVLVGMLMLFLGMAATVVSVYDLVSNPETFAGNFFCDDVAA